MPFNTTMELDDIYDAEKLIKQLQDLASHREKLNALPKSQQIELLKAAGKLTRPSKFELKAHHKKMTTLQKKELVHRDKQARASTGIRKAREVSVFQAPQQIASSNETKTERLESPRNCYVCKAEFQELHHFYDSMCPKCAEFNYLKRFQTTSLDGQVALITGARLKIGYHAALMMLRAGASVIATTRFPKDAAVRFSKEPDFQSWKNRLQVYGLDLRHSPSVEVFCQHIVRTTNRLDILINNAAQTVRRPPGFYAHMLPLERTKTNEMPSDCQGILRNHTELQLQLAAYESKTEATTALTVGWQSPSAGMGITSSAELSQIPYSYDNALAAQEIFPEGQLDVDLQQVDLRTTNSWRLKIDEVQTPEVLEVQLVNAIAPFILCSKLTPLMKRDFTGQKHIVNVTAMEGKFHRFKKEDRHPHTNMAKAALNMMTHTAAGGLAKYGIFMNAVDTGWVTDEDPVQLAESKRSVHDFQPPLDIVDGAARVCDPFFHGIQTGQHWCGKFLKDYFPIDW